MNQIQFRNLPEKPENTKAWAIRVQRWMTQLDAQWGPPSDLLCLPADDELPDVVVAVYHNKPAEGYLIALTYGISECEEQAVGRKKPELALVIQTDNLQWAQAIGYLSAWMRSVEVFEIGAIFDFKTDIAPPSQMDGFVITPLNHYLEGKLPVFKMLRFSLNYLQVVPIYMTEEELLKKVGLSKFLGASDFGNPDRDRLA